MADPELSWAMKVYNGLGKDIERLMHNFVETGSIRYEGFARIWQEMNFSMVYCGLRSLENMREFLEEAFRLSVLYLSPPFDFQQRTGGLYIVYAFYFSQRHRPRIKVRLSRQQWKDLMVMEADLKRQGHLDAYYILLKLKMNKAFCFAYSSQQFIFQAQAQEENQDKWLAENQREIEQAFPESLLRRLHDTHHKYQLLKNQLGISEEENLKHVKQSMAEVIANRFSSDIDENPADTPSEASHVNRVAEIKERSFLRGVESDEQISSSTPGSNASSESDNALSPARKRRGRKPHIPPPPDNRSMVERLMPVLKEYTLSDSEEEQDKPSAEAAEKEPEKTVQSPTESTKNSPSPSLGKRRRKTPTPGSKSSKKSKPGKSTSESSTSEALAKKVPPKVISPKRKKTEVRRKKPGPRSPKTTPVKSKSTSESSTSSALAKKASPKVISPKRKKTGRKKPGPGSPKTTPVKRNSTSKSSTSDALAKKVSLKVISPKRKKTEVRRKKPGSPKTTPVKKVSRRMAKITPLNK